MAAAESCFPVCQNFEGGFGHAKVQSSLSDCVRRHHNLTKTSNSLQISLHEAAVADIHNREAARSNSSSIEASIISLNTTISVAILKMSKSP